MWQHGGRFLNGVSLRRCHISAGLVINITFVSATKYPATKHVIDLSLSREKLDKLTPAMWLDTIKKVIAIAVDKHDGSGTKLLNDLGQRYKRENNLEDSGLNVYVRDCQYDWFSLTSPKGEDKPWLPQQANVDLPLPEFLVTGSEGT
eukprot:GHVU01005462.1.p1 GENE.GHVU01005462.1~~GHVU01005462.1.p1  ORF type:complete len:147 (-),score=8.81 GHVU01005462.1:154-594(-)